MLDVSAGECYSISRFLLGGLAQLVEQRNHNPRVGGSCPSPATMFAEATFRSGAAVAQVTVNHLVAGSNPAFGATLRTEVLLGAFFYVCAVRDGC